MPRSLFAFFLAGLALTACGQVSASPGAAADRVFPISAPPIYRSADKNLTFPTPTGAYYCPKPEEWIGSDHGTVVFLTAPKACGGGGYASSERGALDAPNIQVYYGYVLDEEVRPAPAPCEEIGRVVLLGSDRPLCLTLRGAIVEVRAEAPYMADIKAEAVFNLVTDAARLETDLATFRDLLRRTSTCNRTDVDETDHTIDRPACAAEAVWY